MTSCGLCSLREGCAADERGGAGWMPCRRPGAGRWGRSASACRATRHTCRPATALLQPLRAAGTPAAPPALATVVEKLPTDAGRKLGRALVQAALTAPAWPDEGQGEGSAPAAAGDRSSARCGLLAVAQRCAGPLGLPALSGPDLGPWLEGSLGDAAAAFSAEDQARATQALADWTAPLPAAWLAAPREGQEALRLPKLFPTPEPSGQPPAVGQPMLEQVRVHAGWGRRATRVGIGCHAWAGQGETDAVRCGDCTDAAV